MEIAMEKFFKDTGATAFTNTFQDLHGMKQLPGLATQRLMEKGYGYGGEGDWKTAALTRVMKIIADNKETTFMEDYTYHFEKGNERVLGAHMLEICPTIAEDKAKIEVHPLGIGDKEDPARLVFKGKPGEIVCASLIDMGGRFRLIIQEATAVEVTKDMPKLPVARTLWKLKPSLEIAAEAWILAGGAHHTVLSHVVTTEDLIDWAEMMDIEYVVINDKTDLTSLKLQLKMSEMLWKLK
jgi:L-arabinose isomerase